MSFSISFSAASKYSAEQKLHDAHLPGAVKAVIEKALDGMPWSRQAPPSSGAGIVSEETAFSGQGRVRAAVFIGVHVEAHGHVDGAGCEIPKISVRPLYD